MRKLVLAAPLVAVAVAAVAFASTALSASRNGGGELWLTGQDASKIYVVRGLGRVDSIELPYGTSPHFARLSPSGKYVYVPSLGYGNVTVIRAQDREVVAAIRSHPPCRAR